MAENKYKKSETRARVAAVDAATTKSKDHRHRKNPRSAEIAAEQRHERNMARPAQRWVGGESVAEGGHWSREN